MRNQLTLQTVDYAVYGPSKQPGKERVIMDGEKERQGDFVFTASETGEYRFCFDNSLSTFSDKTVDFEITVRYIMPFYPTTRPLTASVPPNRSKTNAKPSSHKKPALALSNSAASKNLF